MLADALCAFTSKTNTLPFFIQYLSTPRPLFGPLKLKLKLALKLKLPTQTVNSNSNSNSHSNPTFTVSAHVPGVAGNSRR